MRENFNFIMRRLYYLMLFFVSISSYSQSAIKEDITLTILKDSIENNSLVMVEFFNHSTNDYYLPLDISMTRYLTFNSEYASENIFSLKENWYDKNMKLGKLMGSDVTDCMDPSQSLFSSKSKEKEKNFKNIDVLLIKSKTRVRIQIPIVYFKQYYYKCVLYYWETAGLLANFQLEYHVTRDSMEQLRKGNEYYSRKNLEDQGYQLYTEKIESNIIPLKISEKMKAFINDYPSYNKAFLEIETE
ncbi:hypothetical protein [Myroides odoratus]|uniref:hypothetical protein n=1 Tax=Myroides odoratus TaxID=256 RepID=UPI00333FCE38